MSDVAHDVAHDVAMTHLGGEALELLQGAEALERGPRLHHQDRDEREDGVLPVLVQEPETGGEELKHGDGAHQLLLQDLNEGRGPVWTKKCRI